MLVGCKNTCFWVSLWLTVIQFLSVILNNTSRELKGKAERQGGQGHVKAQVMNFYRKRFTQILCASPSFPPTCKNHQELDFGPRMQMLEAENVQFIYWWQHKLACKAGAGHEQGTSPS